MSKREASSRYLEYVPLDEVFGWTENPKDHDVGVVDRSIKRFGFLDPLVLCERKQQLAAGHGRLLTLHAQMLAKEAPPDGIQVRGDGMWLAPVTRGWSSKNDREFAAAVVALNQATILGGWHDDKLEAVLKQVAITPAGLDGTGFDDDDLRRIVGSVAQVGTETAPPAPDAPYVKVGDVWHLGSHRIMCGKSHVRGDVATLLAGDAIDCILTDPPYCSGGFQEADRIQGSVGTGRKDNDGDAITIANDVLSTRGYRALISAVLEAWPSRLAYVFTDWRMWTNLTDILESHSYGLRSMIVWNKETPGMGRGWLSQHELIAVGTRVKSPFPQHPARGNVISCPRSGNDHHPNEKPVDLLFEVLENTARDIGQMIGDPFLGSGSTVIACERLGRVCYGMEQSPRYLQVVIERWQQFTGKQAERVIEGGAEGQAHEHAMKRARKAQAMKRNNPSIKRRK